MARTSNNLCRAIEESLDDVGRRMHEIDIDGACQSAFQLAWRELERALADGYVSRREYRQVKECYQTGECGLVQVLALDVEGLECARTHAGRLDGMCRKEKAPIGVGA